jgi:outer membrane murein-binding lipoprotein Lpp
MKKGILLLFAAGALLVSCGGNSNEEAAKAFCDCYEQAEDVADAAGEAESFSEMMAAAQEQAEKAKACIEQWQTDYEGKIDKEGFAEALKKENEDIYKKAEEMGMFQ